MALLRRKRRRLGAPDLLGEQPDFLAMWRGGGVSEPAPPRPSGNTEGYVAGSPKGGRRGTIRPAGTPAPTTDVNRSAPLRSAPSSQGATPVTSLLRDPIGTVDSVLGDLRSSLLSNPTPPVLGEPSLEELLSGDLGVNQAGKITTPRTRRVSRQLARARERLAGSGDYADLSRQFPELSPEKIRALQESQERTGTPAGLLAAISGHESDFGRSTLPGVHGGQNFAGAAGPFQIGNGTGAAGNAWEQVADELWGPRADEHSIYKWRDAALGAGQYLQTFPSTPASKDPSTWRDAAFSYNHADWYAQGVASDAARYTALNRPVQADPGAQQAYRRAAARARRVGIRPGRPGGDAPTAMPVSLEQRPGPYAGSRRIVSALLGQPVWGDKEPGHSAGGMHDPANPDAYAQDIGSAYTEGNPAEGEPPYSQDTVSGVARRLRRRGADIPANFQLGENWEGGVNGYDIEFLTAPHGTGPHIHLGAEYSGSAPPAGTYSGAPSGTAGQAATLIAAGAPAPLVGQAVAESNAPPAIPLSTIAPPISTEVPLPEDFQEVPSSGVGGEDDGDALLELLTAAYGTSRSRRRRRA